MSLLDNITNSIGVNLSKLWERVKDTVVYGVTESDMTWVTEQEMNERIIWSLQPLKFNRWALF